MYHIIAKSILKNKKLDLYFKSIKEAKEKNPHLTDFYYKKKYS